MLSVTCLTFILHRGLGNDIHTKLVKEVITEACKIIYGGGNTEARLFLEENFNLENMGEIKNEQ